jgi:pimeloyl-ACP methyl ester carboxylesterase
MRLDSAPVAAPSSIRHTSANGIDFAYLEDGPSDGPLALCLHGFPDHAPTWDRLLGDLAAAGFHAVAPWMRGYAPTTLAPDGNYQVASLALDAIALADAIAAGSDAVIIGHDWGAIAAYTTVNYAPERFSKLVTLAVPHPTALAGVFSSPEQIKRSFYIFVFQTPLAEMIVPNDDYAFIDFLWRTWSPGHEPSEEFMRRLKDTLASPGSTEAAIGYYRAMLGTTPSDPALDAVTAAGIGPVQVPTLYLHGADDGCMGVELVQEEELRALHPGGLDLEIVPASGHFLHLDQPEVVNRRILDFVAG